MDQAKCEALKRELATQPSPQIVPIERYLDGNDDVGSIGCNLYPHPGMDEFHEVFTTLLRHRGVEQIYARISELDSGETDWPFTDTVLVVGSISKQELAEFVKVLSPDDVGGAEDYGVDPEFVARQALPVHVIWWD